MTKPRMQSEAMARNPRTVITAIAQWGKPEFDDEGWRDPGDCDGSATEVRIDDIDESMVAVEAAAAEEREEATESATVVSVIKLRVRRVGKQEEQRQKRVGDPRSKGKGREERTEILLTNGGKDRLGLFATIKASITACDHPVERIGLICAIP